MDQMSDNAKDNLGDRMKMYEGAARTSLPRRLPVIIRIDGKAFHTYTRGCKRPFDEALSGVMNKTAEELCKEIQGSQVAYVQSDEISILLHNYKKFTTSAWFDNQVQKIVSVAAGIASAKFTAESHNVFGETRLAVFDARVFVVPEAEVCNYFIWRQQDNVRNSVQMAARSVFSHKECDDKSVGQLKEMLISRGKSWELETWRNRFGRVVTYDETLSSIGSRRVAWITHGAPVFVENRDFINNMLKVEEE